MLKIFLTSKGKDIKSGEPSRVSVVTALVKEFWIALWFRFLLFPGLTARYWAFRGRGFTSNPASGQ
jgi:hypothetical protein